MTEHDVHTATRPAGACSMCPHLWADHDALGVRFCTASRTAKAKDRGCICRSSATVVV